MYCKNCGGEMNENQAICLNCGVPAGKGNTHCHNCGNQVSELASICVKCGVLLKKEEKTSTGVVASKAKADVKVRSLSIIPKLLLTALAIVMMFVYNYFSYEYYSYWSHRWYSYTCGLANWVEGWIAIPIFFMAISLIMSFASLFKSKKAFGWIGFAASLIAFIGVVVLSMYISIYHGSDFLRFEICFYVEIIANLLLCAVSLFDGIGKPLLKIKSKG